MTQQHSKKTTGRGTYLGLNYSITVWFEAERYFVTAIEVDGYPRLTCADLPGYLDRQSACEAGEKRAHEVIDDITATLSVEQPTVLTRNR